MIDFETFAVVAAGVLGAVFVGEAIYALFFRNFGPMTFRLSFDVPQTDAAIVWATYFAERNDWNSVSERLSYQVVSETPRVVRLSSRLRGSNSTPVTMDVQIDMDAAKQTSRIVVLRADGVAVPAAAQTIERFDVTPGEGGAHVEVELQMPVRGWAWVPVHRRNLARIYEDLRVACLVKAGVPHRLVRRRWLF